MLRKRMTCLLLAVIMVVSLSACGKKKEESASSGGNPPAEQSQQAGGEAKPEDAPEGGQTAKPEGEAEKVPVIPGKLTFIELEDRDSSILHGLRMEGNRAGTEDFNHKDPSTEGIRCIFELSEWAAFYLDADVDDGIRAWVIKHSEDGMNYAEETPSEESPGFAAVCDLAKNPDDEEFEWGSFYLDPSEAEKGYYDIVFTYNGKAIATTMFQFFGETELEGKSDAELEKINSSVKPQ